MHTSSILLNWVSYYTSTILSCMELAGSEAGCDWLTSSGLHFQEEFPTTVAWSASDRTALSLLEARMDNHLCSGGPEEKEYIKIGGEMERQNQPILFLQSPKFLLLLHTKHTHQVGGPSPYIFVLQVPRQLTRTPLFQLPPLHTSLLLPHHTHTHPSQPSPPHTLPPSPPPPPNFAVS